MLVRIQGRRQFSLSDSYHFSMQLNTKCSSHAFFTHAATSNR